MTVSVNYSVKANDIEEARAWVEEATGLSAEGRESNYWGGDYYAFNGEAGEKLKVINNRDPIDGELIIGDDPDCRIGLIVDETKPDSAILEALQRAPDRFVRLEKSPS
jgi:hypothetical protein